MSAKIVSLESLAECGERLRNGNLVAFPTETVYGLGCHALDPEAITKVFRAKERPLTDPLIVHVSSKSEALRLWQQDEHNSLVLESLMDRFWPGPLTLVAKAAPHVPPILMANTGYVACRSPSLAVARQLIDEARVPIAAPSANKFGHVSPTRAQHVLDDLQHENVWILDANVDCHVGVESTVAKLVSGELTVLRQGAVSVHDLEECLQEHGVVVERMTNQQRSKHVATVAPGQTIRHYSPNIPSFILAKDATTTTLDADTALETTVLIDFGGRLGAWSEYAKAYRDLSASGDSSQAAQSVFDTLRWAERVEGATRILFPELAENSDALTLAVKDRLMRAASGIIINSLS